jgi:DNA-binding MarR family transcriptional regulator
MDAAHRQELAEQITGPLSRRHSTATVLFHQAVAERLGLGPADHKCLDLLVERGSMSGSQLAAVTGLTSGAITGVVNRLERAGYVRRQPDPDDRRKQVLTPVDERINDIQEVFRDIRPAFENLLDGFDVHQLTAIAEFLTRSTEFARDRATTLRAQARSAERRPQTSTATRERTP